MGNMAQASSLADITDSTKTTLIYYVQKNNEWVELKEEKQFFEKLEGAEHSLKIGLEWSVEDVESITQERFFTFAVPGFGRIFESEIVDQDKNIIGEVFVNEEGEGKATFSAFNKDELVKDSHLSGVIEIEIPSKEQSDALGNQEEVSEGQQAEDPLLRGPPRAPFATYYVEYIVYINNQETVVNTFSDLAFGSVIPDTNYDLPEIDGKTFVYWYEKGKPETEPFDMNTRVTRDITLVAHYANAHYVSFKSVGSDVDDRLVGHGEKVTAPSPVPTRQGYSFSHWSKEKDGAVAFDFNEPIIRQTVLYAVWDPMEVSYRVTYWVEKPDMPFDFDENDHANYDFVYEDEGPGNGGYRALTGSAVSVSPQQAASVVNWNWEMDPSDPMYGFMGSKWDHSSTETVEGDGGTIVKVYYKRYSFKYTFDFSEYGETGVVGLQKPADTYITYERSPGEYYYRTKPYEIEAKWGQKVAELGEGVLDIWPGSTANIKRDYEPRYYIGWALDWQQFHAANAGYLTTLGVGTISHTVLPNSRADGSHAFVYPVFTRTPMVFENFSFTTLGSWQNGSGWEGGSIYDTYYRYPKGDYTLPGWATGKPTTHAPEGFRTISTHYANQYFYPSDTFNWDSHVISSSDNKTHVRLVTLGERLNYNIAFATNGGNAIDTKTLEFERPLHNQVPPDPSKGADVFDGWYTDQFLTQKFDWNTTMPAKNFVLYAKWLPRDHSVTYFEKDGTELGVDYYEKGDLIDEPTETTLGSGDYVLGNVVPGKGKFLGWQWRPGPMFASFDRFGAEIYRDYELYANWGSEYTVRYDSDGGVGTTPTDPKNYFGGSQVDVLPADLSKNGMPLVGWRVKDGAVPVKVASAGSRVTINNNIVFVAVYAPELASTLLSVEKKIYKEQGDVADNKIKVTLDVPANTGGLEANIITASNVTSMKYAFLPYNTDNPLFSLPLQNEAQFSTFYAAATVKGELLSSSVFSTDVAQKLTYEISVPDNGRLILWTTNERSVTDSMGFSFQETSGIANSLIADNVYTKVSLKHKGVGKVSGRDDIELYSPTNDFVSKMNNDSAQTGQPLDTGLYGIPVDQVNRVISTPRYGYDTTVIMSYEALGDIGLPVGIKPFWRFDQPQDLYFQETLNKSVYLAGYIHPFNYVRSTDLKPAKFLKVDSSKQPITTDTASFIFKSENQGEKVVDGQGNEYASIVLSTTAAQPFIVVPVQLPGTYVLTETKAPSGYNLLTRDIVITVDSQGAMTASIGSQPLEEALLQGVDKDAYSIAFYIVNKTAAELPSAGGMGTLFFILGSAIALFIAALLFQGRRGSYE